MSTVKVKTGVSFREYPVQSFVPNLFICGDSKNITYELLRIS